jgi:hypothetical protein
VVRLDDVGEGNGLRALRALHLHVTPRSPVAPPGLVAALVLESLGLWTVAWKRLKHISENSRLIPEIPRP